MITQQTFVSLPENPIRRGIYLCVTLRMRPSAGSIVGKIVERNDTAYTGQGDWGDLVIRGDSVRVQLRCCKKNRERGDRTERLKVECGFTMGFHRAAIQVLCNEIPGEEAISYSAPILAGIMIRKMGDPFTFFSGK